MKLNPLQRKTLIDASKAGVEFLDATITQLKAESPEAFHTARTLARRRFHHKPATAIRCRNAFDARQP